MSSTSLPSTTEMANSIKHFLLTEVLPGEDPSQIDETTPLMSSAVLDSTSTLKLILFIEEQFGVELEARDLKPSNLETIGSIIRTIQSRFSQS